ncbi:NYN domain-containing protein [Nocardia sp. AB354]|uniref:NYN domain-containing protein n=1 Tax=Nocardia sp. AB354 TaxID=3413283 RepID=UPI003C1743E3
MRVGVYVDAYNLYYGMRDHCGRGTAGWRWLDVRALAQRLCGWQGATIDRVVYCTAQVDAGDSPGGYARQDAYLKALKQHGSIDVLQLGRYVAWAKTLPLADVLPSGRPRVIKPNGNEVLPAGLPVWDQNGDVFMARVQVREEKGSDVNVATHLLADVFMQHVDAAIVISNDSDLGLPLGIARTLVPVGTVNPGTKPLAGALRGLKTDGPGGHWWGKLSKQHFYSNQMPPTVGRWSKPPSW